ncbi:MAG TPA: RCC1 domain-containing protein [Gemmatimonadales bacterium]|nr:RCC1 domain-containing protein [Gemmatimonadales bacterium]
MSPHPGGKENKFTITSTAPGSCEQTVTDGDGNSVVVPVEVVVLQRGTLTNGSFHTCGLTSAGQDYCWGWNGRG